MSESSAGGPVKRSPQDLDAQDGVAERVWFVPRAEGVEPHYVFDQIGGQKRYLNLWTDSQEVTWNWVLHDSAVLLWEQDGAGGPPIRSPRPVDRDHPFEGDGQYCQRWRMLVDRMTSQGRLVMRDRCGYGRDTHPDQVRGD